MTDKTYETESLHTHESLNRDAGFLGGDGAAPTGSNADEWALFLSEWGTAYCAVRIAEALEAAEQRGYARGIEAAVKKVQELAAAIQGDADAVMQKHPQIGEDRAEYADDLRDLIKELRALAELKGENQ